MADGDALGLGAPKQRAVLATLLLRRNRLVTRDELVDAIWAERAPEAAARSLQVYVHGLRRSLGPERIETRGAGYSLHVEPGELDLDRFESHVEQARRALAAGDAAGAAEQVSAALALWRGTPLADLAGEPVADLHRGPLEELHLGALELRGDAELGRGRHAQLVPELESLVAAHPYRERFREQLVLALYRGGRQKEALEAYRDARRTLAEDLGVDPGPALQQLEGAILRHDPVLAAPEDASGPRVSLASPPTPLVGRRLETAAVVALFRDGARLVTLTGPGGTGKTRLALAAAEELAGVLADEVVFVDLAPVNDPSLLGPTIAESLGVQEGESSLGEAVAERLRTGRWLLVLDNLEQLLPGTPFVGDLLARAPGLRVLATSRAALRLRAEQEYPVPPLEPPDTRAAFEQLAANDAVRLFVQRARAFSPDFQLTDGNAASVAAICARLDGLPLAIELAAGRTRLIGPAEIAGRLGRTLELLTGGARDLAPRQQTLRATLDWSYDALEPDARSLLARLGVFAGGCSLEAVEAVCGAEALDALAPLVEGNLLRRVRGDGTGGRFAMLETIRDYAADLLAVSGEETDVRRRHCRHFLGVAEAVSDVILGGADDEALYDQLDREHDNVRAAIDWAVEAGERELEVRLVEAMRYFWTVRGHLREGRRRFEHALAATASGEPQLRARALVRGGIFPFRLGDSETARAWWEESLALARELEDVDGITWATSELGAVAIAEGELEDARALCEEAAAGWERLGNKLRLGIVTSNLAAIANMQDDLPAARKYAEETVALQEETGDTTGLSITLHNLARTCLRLGESSEGRQRLKRSLELARAFGYRELIAYALEGAAEVAAADGDDGLALRLLAVSEALFADVGAAIQGEEAEGAEQLRSQLQQSLGAEALEEARTAARRAGVESAMDEALALLGSS